MNGQTPPGGTTNAPAETVTAVAFSPDGETLAVSRRTQQPSGWSGRVELWDVASGKTRRVIKGFDGSVWAVSFSPDGRSLVTGSSEFRDTSIQGGQRAGKRFVELKWWDPETGELQREAPISDDLRALMAAYSPDGKQIAMLEYSYDVTPMLAQHRMGGFGTGRHGWPPRNTTPAERLLALNGEARLLDAATGNVTLKLKGKLKTLERSTASPGNPTDAPLDNAGWHSPPFKPVVFSPDGRYLAGGTRAEVRVWDSKTGDDVHTFEKFAGDLNAYCFSPDSRQLATVSTAYEQRRQGDNVVAVPKSEIRLYDIKSGEVVQKIAGQGDVLTSVTFAPDGKALFLGSVQYEEGGVVGNVKIWIPESGKVMRHQTGGEQPVQSVVFSPKADLLALDAGSEGISLLETNNWKVVRKLVAEKDSDDDRAGNRFVVSLSKMQAITFLADGHSVAGASDTDGFKLWDTRTGELKERLAAHNRAGSAVTALLTDDGKTMVTVREDRSVSISDVASGKPGTSFQAAGPEPFTAAAVNAGGSILALGDAHGIALWDTRSGAARGSLQPHGTVDCLAFSHASRGDRGYVLASASDDGTIELWDVATRKLQRTLNTMAKVTALAISPDGLWLASAAQDKSISVWEMGTGSLRQRLRKHEDVVRALAFSPNGRLLVSGGDDRTAVVWEAGSGKALHTLRGHELAVTALAFSPDGNVIASGAGNATVVLWDVQTGKLNRILH